MINERALEFLCLSRIVDVVDEVCAESNTDITTIDYLDIDGNKVSFKAILDRHKKIFDEILEPYVIDNTSKED